MISFGILGCARICRRGMIEGIRSSGAAILAAIASRQSETARRWACEFNIPHAYTSYDALLEDRTIDAVYIPLPNDLHAEYTLKAAERGKHVLCEKPLARSVDEAAQMVAAARRHGVVLMEAFMWRHHPRIRHARQMVARGELGELRLVKMDFSFDIDRADWRLQAAQGGGALFDLGCYGINAARLFFGAEPIEVTGWSREHSTGVDMTDAFCLRFPNGAAALIDCSFECPYRNQLELVGTKAAIELPEGVLPPAQSQLLIHKENTVETIPFGPAHQYTEQVKAFCTSIERGALVAPAEDGLANMQALENVRKRLAPL
jgi:D-xylose 1-dehydrogenase (NADP+, D-xylono-1,5-lactone-forming)